MKNNTEAAHLFSARYPNVSRALSVLGKRRITRILGIPLAQFNRTLADIDPLSASAESRARDLDCVLARAFEVMQPATIVDWLEGVEQTLGFAQPIEVLILQGKGPLLDVLNRLASVGYA